MSKTSTWTPLAVCLLSFVFAAPTAAARAGDEIPITTSSEEARDLFIKGRDLAENLRASDARAFYVKAVEKDPDFAMGHLAMANTAPTTREFFASMAKAVSAAEAASPGERHLIMAQHEAAQGNRAKNVEHLQALVAAHPDDARAHAAMGGYYYNQQEWAKAIEHYERATALKPEYAPAYNMLGYACRGAKNAAKAETAFQKYIELIPDEPNPYDSYAEFLMESGRYGESINYYRMALEKNPEFVASYIGIGANQIYMGEAAEARKTFESMEKVARNPEERRDAAQWTAASFVQEGKARDAVNAVQGMAQIAAKNADKAAESEDHILIGNILCETGSPEQAVQHYTKAVELIEAADVPEESKQRARRNHHYFLARSALAAKNVDGATEEAAKYAEQIRGANIAFETRRHHELAGNIALQRGDAAMAVEHLTKANQQNPQVLLALARAYDKKGDKEAAKRVCEAAAKHNPLDFRNAFVRKEAEAMLKGVKPAEAGADK